MAGNLLAASFQTDKVYRFTGFTSTISASFTKTDAEGVAWDGTDVYFGEEDPGSPPTKIFKGTGFSATVAASITAPNASESTVYGIDLTANTAGDLLVVQNSSKIWRMSGFSSSISSSVTLGSSNRGVAWDGTNLMTADNGDLKYRRCTGFSSTVASSFAAPGTARDITWDGTDFYSAISATPASYKKHSGFSSTITSSFNAPTGVNNPVGIKWDGFPSTPSGPSTLESWDTVAKANIESMNTVALANIESWNTVA